VLLARRNFTAASEPAPRSTQDIAHRRITKDVLPVIQPKTTALTKIGVRTAPDTVTQVAIRPVGVLEVSTGSLVIVRSRLVRSTSRCGKKPSASFVFTYVTCLDPRIGALGVMSRGSCGSETRRWGVYSRSP